MHAVVLAAIKIGVDCPGGRNRRFRPPGATGASIGQNESSICLIYCISAAMLAGRDSELHRLFGRRKVEPSSVK